MQDSRTTTTLLASTTILLWNLVFSTTAAADNWAWGPPGFSRDMTWQQREDYLLDHGLADPHANYWTPFWQTGNAANSYTNYLDTSYRNEFAVNHDINAEAGIPIVGYLDIFTPLVGTNELEINATIGDIWDEVTGVVSDMWDSVTSVFHDSYQDYTFDLDWDSVDWGFDNAFDISFDFDDWNGGCNLSGILEHHYEEDDQECY